MRQTLKNWTLNLSQLFWKLLVQFVAGLDLICFVARHVANRRNISVSKAVQRINAQLSCSLMRFNALSVIERDQQAILRERERERERSVFVFKLFFVCEI